MRAGELRQRIVIQEKIVERDAFNAEVESWATWATVWAKVETISGDEYIAQQAAGATLTHKITMRWHAGLLPTMIVIWASRTLEIHAIIEDDHRREMMLMCNEAVTTMPTGAFVIGESLIGGRDVIV